MHTLARRVARRQFTHLSNEHRTLAKAPLIHPYPVLDRIDDNGYPSCHSRCGGFSFWIRKHAARLLPIEEEDERRTAFDAAPVNWIGIGFCIRVCVPRHIPLARMDRRRLYFILPKPTRRLRLRRSQAMSTRLLLVVLVGALVSSGIFFLSKQPLQLFPFFVDFDVGFLVGGGGGRRHRRRRLPLLPLLLLLFLHRLRFLRCSI